MSRDHYITAVLLERELAQLYVLQRVEPTHNFGVFTKITAELILGLDILHAQDASMDLGCHVLWPGKEEMPVRRPGARPSSFPNMKGSSKVVTALSGRLVTARMEGPLEVADRLAEPGSKAIHQAGLHRARTSHQPPKGRAPTGGRNTLTEVHPKEDCGGWNIPP
jgi:hypothetical protein